MKPETIAATRKHFADNARACAADAKAGAFFVNDLPTYCAERESTAVEIERGDWDHTFTFKQYAHWLETGECVALLP